MSRIPKLIKRKKQRVKEEKTCSPCVINSISLIFTYFNTCRQFFIKQQLCKLIRYWCLLNGAWKTMVGSEQTSILRQYMPIYIHTYTYARVYVRMYTEYSLILTPVHASHPNTLISLNRSNVIFQEISRYWT